MKDIVIIGAGGIVREVAWIIEEINEVNPIWNIIGFVEIGQGTIIYPGVILTVNTRIGNHVIVSGNCGIGYDTVIGDFSSVLWGSCFSGFDVVGEECFVGVRVKLAQGITITDGRRVSTDSIIMEDIM